MARIGVTGANGQLGRELQRVLVGQDAVFADVEALDITDLAACQRWVESHALATVINAAAYTDVEGAEDQPELAHAVNCTGVANLAKAMAGAGGRLVHVSTDYVFAGAKNTPYVEDDATGPLSVYGRTKLAGEAQALTLAPTVAVVRTGWVYSAQGKNFVKTMLRLGAERTELNVVCDQVGTPTHAGHLAAALVQVAERLPVGTQQIYHYADEGVASWYDFAAVIMQTAGLACRVNPVPARAYPTKATRPAYGVLDKQRIKDELGVTTMHWQKELATCLQQLS